MVKGGFSSLLGVCWCVHVCVSRCACVRVRACVARECVCVPCMPTRLRDRGYPPRFLRKAFGPAPRLGRLRALAMPYSRELERTNPARVLHAHGALLPSHLVGDKSLVAWCAAPRLTRTYKRY